VRDDSVNVFFLSPTPAAEQAADSGTRGNPFIDDDEINRMRRKSNSGEAVMRYVTSCWAGWWLTASAARSFRKSSSNAARDTSIPAANNRWFNPLL